MKKLLALACSLVFLFSFAACGRNSDMGDMAGDGMSKIESGVESTVDKVTGGDRQTMTAKISADEAKQAAFKHAGVSENDVTGLDVDLDRDNGVLKYEIDFYSGGIEYDYDVNAENGDIISADKDRD